MRLYKVLACLVFTFFSSYSYASIEVFDRRIDPNLCSFLDLTKKGEIASGDALKFLILYSQFVSLAGKDGCLAKQIVIDSDGGNLEEALELGRKIREFEFTTVVVNKGRCLSACVFVFGAGVNRINLGSVGIHRPYFYKISSSASSVEIRKSRDEISSKIKRYLAEIDVSEQLLDDMLSVPPEKMKILTDDELARYRLEGVDATYDEKRTAKEASEYGISSSEYRKREALARAQCTGKKTIRLQGQNVRVDDRNFECEESVKLGISQSEYKRRQEKVRNTCLRFKDDLKKFKNCADVIRLNG